nr:rare lipoprotein [Candidatus Cloacimonadota bacterium]
MRKMRKKLSVTFLSLQLLFIAPVIADSVAGMGSDEFKQDQAELLMDSQHSQEPPGRTPEKMIASYYADYFHGQTTANGETFNQYAMTCAHKTLPFNTRLRVTNPQNGKSVEVRVNDRGPYLPDRDIDLSFGAAKKIGLIRPGVAEVEVYILHPENSTHLNEYAVN